MGINVIKSPITILITLEFDLAKKKYSMNSAQVIAVVKD